MVRHQQEFTQFRGGAVKETSDSKALFQKKVFSTKSLVMILRRSVTDG